MIGIKFVLLQNRCWSAPQLNHSFCLGQQNLKYLPSHPYSHKAAVTEISLSISTAQSYLVSISSTYIPASAAHTSSSSSLAISSILIHIASSNSHSLSSVPSIVEYYLSTAYSIPIKHSCEPLECSLLLLLLHSFISYCNQLKELFLLHCAILLELLSFSF